MRTRLIILLCVIGLAAATAEPVLAQRRSLGRRTVIPTRVELSQAGLDRQWFAQAGFDPTSDKLKSISSDEELVYVVSERGNLTAFDAETGNRMWVLLLGSDIDPVAQPVSNASQVLTAVGMKLVAIDKYTGAIQWELRIDGQPTTAPAVDDSNVYVGTLDGRVHAYSLRKVRELFNVSKLPEYSFNAKIWTYRAPSELTSPPSTSGRSVNFASRSGIFTSVNASDRQLQYLFGTDGEILGPVSRTADRAIIPSTDRNVYCIDSRNGQILWTFASGLPVVKPMAALAGHVYVSPGRLGLFQLDLTTGVREWSQPAAGEFVAATPSSVFSVDSLNNLLVLDPKNGDVRGRVRTPRFEHHTQNTRTDRIYMATSSGLVLSLREQGREFPMFHRYPELRPVMPDFASEQAEAETADVGEAL